jgi:hypothetical protein
LPRIRGIGQCNFWFRPVFNHKIAMKQAVPLLSAMGDMRFLSKQKNQQVHGTNLMLVR